MDRFNQQEAGARMHQRSPAEQFAVYLGEGKYVSGIHLYGAGESAPVGFVHFAPVENCLTLERSEAVAACHAARRGGLSAWIVPNPAGALA